MVGVGDAVMTAEPVFVPRPGQVDYTHIRYAPVLNAVVVCLGKVLLLQRSSGMRSPWRARKRSARHGLSLTACGAVSTRRR